MLPDERVVGILVPPAGVSGLSYLGGLVWMSALVVLQVHSNLSETIILDTEQGISAMGHFEI